MNYTNEELEIARLPKMQEFFREMMGEWSIEDHLYDKRWGIGIIIDTIETRMFVRFNDLPRTPISLFQAELDSAIRLPYSIDTGDTERLARGEKARGLWGMVNWVRYYADIDPEGHLTINGRQARDRFIFHGVPTLALLKALAHQIGAEVEG